MSFSPGGRLDTGRKWDADADVCGLPPTSSEGRGPNFILGFPFELYEEYESRSGLVDCEDLRRSSIDLVGDLGRIISRVIGSRGGGGEVSRSAIIAR